MAQHSSKALWAWGLLAVVAATAPTTLAGGYGESYSSGCDCSGFPSCSNVGSWYCVNNDCKGTCFDGYTGTVTASCGSSGWEVSGECVKIQTPTCSGSPYADYASFPSSCDGLDYVEGTCNAGYTGSISAKCEGGKWVIYGKCVAVPKTCTGKPTYTYGYFDDCSGKNWVKGYCNAGYTGSIYAKCEDGTWVIYGECVKIEVPKCYGTPVSNHGYFKGNCDGKDYVEGCCYDGYEGEIYAKCEYGTWVIYDGCKKVEQPRCDKYCYGTPSIDYGSFPDNCDGLSYVEGCCDEGYKGRIYAKCECGTWVTYGTCQKITYANICYGKPKKQKHAKSFSWKSCHGKSHCSAKCSSGCGGKGYKAKCVHGKWKVTGSCSPKKYYYGGSYGGHY